MTSKRSPVGIPPYVPYRTFLAFLESMRHGVPSHVDKSVLRSMSGGIQGWLKASLKSMKLIDQANVPQDLLRDLAASEGARRKQLLKRVFESTYGFLDQYVDLETTTPAKLEAAFTAAGANGDTVRKAVAFMLSLAKDADVELSPHLLRRGALTQTGSRHSPAVPRKSRGVGDAGVRRAETGDESANLGGGDWEQLVAKFPEFDPGWSDELKARWFDAFERLMAARKP
ncbi:MAG: hypothetical protein AB7F99_09570 [Vicinamibacterales bacterium]